MFLLQNKNLKNTAYIASNVDLYKNSMKPIAIILHHIAFCTASWLPAGYEDWSQAVAILQFKSVLLWD